MARELKFQPEYYYHIYNRGVDKREVFLDKWDYVRFLEGLRYFNQIKPVGSLYHFKKGLISGSAASEAAEPPEQPLVKILAYCLNLNHFHLLLQQKAKNGIAEFIHKLAGGYTGYFNNKYKRSGSLWQGKYKVKEAKSTYDLLKLSIYVNCNAEIHRIAKKEDWIWSSYLDYIGLRNGNLCNKQIALEEFKDILGNIQEYIELCEELIPEIQNIKDLEKYNLE